MGNGLFNNIVDNFHTKILKISSFDPQTTLSDTGYEPFFCINEDFSGNFFHIFIILFVLIYLIINFKSLKTDDDWFALLYFFSLFSGFLIFCFIFKWQPWGSRLHLPFFVLSIPIITYFIAKFDNKSKQYFAGLCNFLSFFLILSFVMKNRLLFFILIIFSIIFWLIFQYLNIKNKYIGSIFFATFVFSIPYVYSHRVRPLLGNNALLFSPRNAKYFRYNLDIFEKYKEIITFIKQNNANNLLLQFKGCFNEYLFWVLLKDEFENFNLKHVYLQNKYVKNCNFEKKIKFRGLISNYENSLNYCDKNNIKIYKRFYMNNDFLDVIIFKKGIII